MKKIAKFISAPLIITSFALANDLNAASYSYPYAGLSIGQATIEDACNVPTGISIVSCEDTDTSFKVYAGAKIHRNLAFELAYIDMGESVIKDNADTLTIEVTGLNASAFGILPATHNIDMFAKAGLMYWQAEKSSSGAFNGTVSSSEGADLTFGFGANFGVSRTLAVRAEFEKFLNVGGEQTTGESDVTLISLGLAYYF